MTRILWVNNLANICGGTLQATHSMVHALPGCEHIVLALAGRFDADCTAAFPQGTLLLSNQTVRELTDTHKPELLVYQNTRPADMTDDSGTALSVYYQHSEHAGAAEARRRCARSFAVSKYLATAEGMPHDDVLYQPVTIPRKHEKCRPRDSGARVTLGRICTPKASKWNPRHVIEPIREAARYGSTRLRFVFVGAPPDIETWVRKELERTDAEVEFHPASYEARGLLHEWHFLLYSTDIQESFGRTVKEAQRCGCYPIVSSVGGFKEQILQPEHGFLFEEVDEIPEAMASALERSNNGDWEPVAEPLMQWGETQGSLSNWRRDFLSRLR